MSIYEKLWAWPENVRETITEAGDILQYILPIFFIAYQACFGTHLVSIVFVLSLGTALILMSLIKAIFNNARPRELNTDDNPDLDLDWSPTEGNSFVSGHSTAAMTSALAYFYINEYFGAVAVLLAVFVGFSRIVAKAHWLRDVLCAFALSAAIVLLYYYFFFIC